VTTRFIFSKSPPLWVDVKMSSSSTLESSVAPMTPGVGSVAATSSNNHFPSIVELNVGGVFYTTTLSTLTRNGESLLGQMFTGRSREPVLRDSKGKYFIDRDGVLFRYTLDYLRDGTLTLPHNFHERDRLKEEADFFQLGSFSRWLTSPASGAFTHQNNPESAASPASDLALMGPQQRSSGYVTVGYRGTFAFGRDGLADVKFRKLLRILVCGRVALCREIFGETLNESRDPDRGATDRYSCRFFLKHSFLEQAFDMLQEAGFNCVASCASGTSSAGTDIKPGMDSEENRWNHYNEFVFVRN